jgi:GTP-binding protein Era
LVDNLDDTVPFDVDSYTRAMDSSVPTLVLGVDDISRNDVYIFFVGAGNAGKSSLINGLLGEPLAEVKSISGWTRETKAYRFADHLYIVDTPGLGDSDTVHLEDGTRVGAHDHADILVFLAPLGSTRTSDELAAYERLRKMQRPLVLVGSKLDLVPDDECDDNKHDLCRRFGTNPSRVRLCSAKDGRGMEELSATLYEILSEAGGGAELIWAKNAWRQDALVRNMLFGRAAAAAALGAIPLPGADIIPLTTLQAKMWMKIAEIYGYEESGESAKSLIASIATGVLGRSVFRTVAKSIALATEPDR